MVGSQLVFGKREVVLIRDESPSNLWILDMFSYPERRILFDVEKICRWTSLWSLTRLKLHAPRSQSVTQPDRIVALACDSM